MKMEPCPFCGTEMEYDDVVETESGIGGLKGEYEGTCWQCGSVGPRKRTKRIAAKFWNIRSHNAGGEFLPERGTSD